MEVKWEKEELINKLYILSLFKAAVSITLADNDHIYAYA